MFLYGHIKKMQYIVSISIHGQVICNVLGFTDYLNSVCDIISGLVRVRWLCWWIFREPDSRVLTESDEMSGPYGVSRVCPMYANAVDSWFHLQCMYICLKEIIICNRLK